MRATTAAGASRKAVAAACPNAREWNYRLNRRGRIDDLADFVLRRAIARPSITYRQLIDGLQPQDALPALTG
jgi:hypothetical protein